MTQLPHISLYRKTILHGLLVLMLTLVPACHKSQPTPQKDTVKGTLTTEFHQTLSHLYETLSNDQAARKRWNNASLFSSKARLVAKGNTPVPEYLRDWDISTPHIQELAKARRMLVDNITSEMLFKAPEKSAMAYFSYDCWIEQAERLQADAPDDCKQSFYESINALRYERDLVTTTAEELSNEDLEDIALQELQQLQDEKNLRLVQQAQTMAKKSARTAKFIDIKETDLTVSVVPIPEENTIPTKKIKRINAPSIRYGDDQALENPISAEVAAFTEQTYIVYFAFDSTKLSEDTLIVLKNVATDIEKFSPNFITVSGHTDRAGSESYNLALSEKRADAVYDKIVEYVKSLDSIETSVFGFGESDPAVETEDGVKHPENRRVEIIIEK